MSRNWRCGRDADRSERGEALEKNSAIHSRSPIATFAGDPTGAIALLPSSLHWHAVRTSPRHEKRVYEHLCYREVESFLPLYCQVHKWKNGCRARVDLPLFPGYLFVKIGHGRRVPVLEVPGILGFAFSRRPATHFCRRRLRGLPVLVHEASRRVWGLRLRRTDPELALSRRFILPSAHYKDVGVRIASFRS